jgi:hypothetical protein
MCVENVDDQSLLKLGAMELSLARKTKTPHVLHRLPTA